MSVLVVSGISGAGKSVFLKTLEDIEFYCIDNLPPALLVAVSKLNVNKKLAVVIDVRSNELYDTLLNEIDNLKSENIDYTLVFLDCDKDTILSRYKYTRRSHPLISEKYPTLESALDYEYELCKKVKNEADIVIDTSHFSPVQLRGYIIESFKQDGYKSLTIKLISFGYKNGLPMEADLVYDVRCLPNPFYIAELKMNSGLDDNVYDYVFSFDQSKVFAEKIYDFIKYSLPYYVEEGKNELVVAIGCTSGRHRSVAFVKHLGSILKDLNHRIITFHRDVEKDF
ncbi:MAG: RNase adapter RapZ [Bacillota bacterium]|nr:RNase adapter RapZ [Bacillota bacterium]NLL26989.1 RNase adapter RapZ [Erysipelotrichia bacterium]